MLLVVLEVPFLVQSTLTVLLESNICRLSSHITGKAALNSSEYAASRLPVTVFPAQPATREPLVKMHHLHPVVLSYCIVYRAALRCSKTAVNV